jgi:hypothetical protein
MGVTPSCLRKLLMKLVLSTCPTQARISSRADLVSRNGRFALSIWWLFKYSMIEKPVYRLNVFLIYETEVAACAARSSTVIPRSAEFRSMKATVERTRAAAPLHPMGQGAQGLDPREIGTGQADCPVRTRR